VLYEAIIVGIIAGWLAKGSITNLAQIRLKYFLPVLGAILILIGMEYFGARGYQEIFQWRQGLYLLSYIMFFIFLWQYRRMSGIKILALGLLCNLLVVMINGGAMPTTTNGLDLEYLSALQAGNLVTNTLITESTYLPWLGDVMVLPWQKTRVLSLGDIFASAGLFWFVFQMMRGDQVCAKLTSVRKMKF
jgi:hypothetical protein